MIETPASAVFAARLKARRKDLGLSQAELGVKMGLPEDVASTRINRYEKGVHAPDLDTMERMAKELGVPLPYLLAQDDRLAEAIRGFAELSAAEQDRILEEISQLVGKKVGVGAANAKRGPSKTTRRR